MALPIKIVLKVAPSSALDFTGALLFAAFAKGGFGFGPSSAFPLPDGDREGMGQLSGQSETRSAILDVAEHYHDYERVWPVNDRGLLMVFGESGCAQCRVLASRQSRRNSLVWDGSREHAHHFLRSVGTDGFALGKCP